MIVLVDMRFVRRWGLIRRNMTLGWQVTRVVTLLVLVLAPSPYLFLYLIPIRHQAQLRCWAARSSRLWHFSGFDDYRFMVLNLVFLLLRFKEEFTVVAIKWNSWGYFCCFVLPKSAPRLINISFTYQLLQVLIFIFSFSFFTHMQLTVKLQWLRSCV